MIVPVATTSWTIVVEGERNALGLLKQDVLRLPFVGNKGLIKAHCTHHLAAIDGTQTLAGLESTLAAWVAAQCDRPLGQELSPDDETRFAKEAGEGWWIRSPHLQVILRSSHLQLREPSILSSPGDLVERP